jgi:hypothetical protein
MPLTATEKIARLEAQLAELRAELKTLKAERAPVIPAPPKPAAPPSWPQSENVGVNYTGGPSAPAGGVTWIRRLPGGDWIDPSGHRRSETGELITGTAAPRPIGPERDPRHQQAVELLDGIVQSTAQPRKEER